MTESILHEKRGMPTTCDKIPSGKPSDQFKTIRSLAVEPMAKALHAEILAKPARDAKRPAQCRFSIKESNIYTMRDLIGLAVKVAMPDCV